MFRLSAAGASALAALFASHSALAHHPGSAGNSGGAGPAITIPATTLEQGHVAVFLLHEYTALSGLNDADLIAAAGKHLHVHSIGSIQSTGLGAAFGVTDDLTVAVRLPFVLRRNIREGTHAHDEDTGAPINGVAARGDSSGIGDATVLGQWRFYNNPAAGMEVALLFGLKLPTGATNVHDNQGELFEAEFQPGSGSTDALIGAAFTQRFGAWSFDANVLYVAVQKGTQQTNLGDRFNYNAAVSYRLFGPSRATGIAGVPTNAIYTHAGHTHRHDDGKMHSHAPEAPPPPQWTLDAILELNGERHQRQTIEGLKDPNSGGHTVYLSPGLRASYGAFSGFVSLGVPVVNDMNGLQSKPDYRLVSGLAFAF